MEAEKKIIQGATKSTKHTRKRPERQKNRHRAKSFANAKRPYRS